MTQEARKPSGKTRSRSGTAGQFSPSHTMISWHGCLNRPVVIA